MGDFYFLISEVEKNGVRPWIWSDYLWHHPDQFVKRMPKSVLQSNWYYSSGFGPTKEPYVKAYLDLESGSFDQVPTGSNWGGHDWRSHSGQVNMMNTVKFCSEYISDSKLLGFLQTSRLPTIEKYREPILNSIQLIGEAKRWYEKNKND